DISGYPAAALYVFDKALEISGGARVVALSEIESNDFNLSFTRYVSAEAKGRASLVELLACQQRLEAELKELQEEFYSLISD
ncbi:hypothetical protein DBR41_12470, partial [Pseudomonas sp. HMWF010]